MYRRILQGTYANVLKHNNYNNADPMNYFIKYLSIGGISTLIQFLLLALLIELKLAPEVIASAIGYILSSIFNYAANYHYTFSSNASHSKTLPKFIIAVGFGLASNVLLFAFFLYLLGFFLLSEHPLSAHGYLIAQFFATGITVFLNFLVHKFWIYKGH